MTEDEQRAEMEAFFVQVYEPALAAFLRVEYGEEGREAARAWYAARDGMISRLDAIARGAQR